MAASERDGERGEIRVSTDQNSSLGCESREDPLVGIELDAARALADFAHLALLESERNCGESSRNWGNKGRRSKKRVKEEFKNFESKDLDLLQDLTVDDNQLHKRLRKTVTTRRIKDEPDIELLRSAPQCSTSCVSSGGGRSKHQSTEAEREAKRLRRVLANRESARQTIRRRQAMCEELMRKAVELAKENESMKLEVELIMKEHQLLKDTNKHLKTQIAKVVKTEEEEHSATPVQAISSSFEKQQPLLVYKKPFIWSPVVHPPNSIKTQPILHDTTVPACKLESFDEHGSFPRPFYILPCPWFIPVGNGLYPHPMDSFGLKQEATLVNPCEGSSSKVTVDVHNHRPSSSRKVLIDAKYPNKVPDTTIRLAPCEENQLGSQPSGSNPTLKSFDTTIVKREDRIHHDPPSVEESGPSTSNHIAAGNSENTKGHSIYQNIKMVDAAAAAATEARKRRRELTKLKNTNGRQFRMQC